MMHPHGQPSDVRGASVADRSERRFHQGTLAVWLALSVAMAWTTLAPWLVLIGAIVQLAGAVSAELSLPRTLHRWLLAPVRSEPPEDENQLPFERADALTGILVVAGAVFVFVGVHPLGWAFVGLSVVSLGLDAMLDRSPLRFMADAIFRLSNSRRP